MKTRPANGGQTGERGAEGRGAARKRVPLKHQPGTRWHYSVSTDVLGWVIEVGSGQSLDQFFQKRIFEPLGMEGTFFTVPQNKLVYASMQ